MSDSLKLRLVYLGLGIALLIVLTAGITALSFLIGFKIIPDFLGIFIFLMFIVLIFAIMFLYDICKEIYELGVNEHNKQ